MVRWLSNYRRRCVRSPAPLLLTLSPTPYDDLCAQELPSPAPEWVDSHLNYCLSLVAIATVCDVVPLDGENRALARLGLEALRTTSAPGLKALVDVALNQ